MEVQQKRRSGANEHDAHMSGVESNRNKILFLEKVRQSNEAIQNGDFSGAIQLYTEAINLDPINHILYSNRSAAYVKIGQFQKGLQDAQKARDLNPRWAKAYYREGVALQCMNRPADALAAFASGLGHDPKNTQLLQGLIEAALKSPIQDKFEPTYSQLQKMKLDKSPFVIISVIGQELLASCFYAASLGVLESALKIGTCSLKLRGSVFSALSSAQWALGSIDKAINFMQQDLAIAKSLGDQEGECRAHGNLGSAYFSKGNYREALTHHRFELVLAMRLKDRKTASSALSNLGHVYTAIGDYPNALASHKQCVLLVRQCNDKLLEAREIGNVGVVYLALGDFDSAVECHQEHLKIAKILGNKSEEARSYSNLGSAHHYKREFEKAMTYHNQVLNIAQDVKDKTLESRAFAGLGHAARAKGDFAEAKTLHEKQLDNALQTKDKVAEGRACSNLGIIMQTVSEFDAALKLHKAHLNIAKELQDRASQGRAYGNIGNAYSALGQHEHAVKFHKQELAISREVNDRHSEAATHGNLAVAYQALKMYEQAVKHYHTHLAISQELRDTVSEARALSNLGNYHSSRGEYSHAIQFYQHFLTLSQELQDTEGEGKACHNLGYAHYCLGNFREAVRYYEQDLTIAKDLQDKVNTGRAYCNLGLAHKNLGNFSEALECQNQFLVITHQCRNVPGKFRALGNIGDVLIKMDNTSEAIKMYNQQLKLAKQVSDKDLEASAYCALGAAHRITGECDKALGFHTQELTIRQETSNVKGECRAHGHLGNVHMSLANYTNAFKCYEEQLDRARDIEDSAIEAQAYGNLGITKMNMGHFDDAIGLFEQQLAMLEQVSGNTATSDKGKAFGNLGDCYEALGDFEEAVKCHDQYLSIAQSTGSALDQDKAYRGLGNAHRAMGNLQQALVCFEKRLVVAHELDNPAAKGSAYGELGCLHSLLGNFEQAVSCLQHQLNIAKEQKDGVGEGDAACGLGGVYQQMGDYEEALDYHNMDLKIAEQMNNTACQCRAYGNLGLSHESLGNFEEAIRYQEQHLSLAAEMNDRVAKTLAYSSLGRVHHALGHYPQAVQYLQQGLQIAEQLGRKEDEAKIRHRLGLALWGHGHLEDAQLQLYRAAELFENIRREAQISSDYKLSLFDLQTASYQALQRVLVALGRSDEALVVAERGRTRAFVDLLLERQMGGEGMYGQNVDNSPMTVEQIVHIVSKQKATVVYYSIAAGFLYCWVISPEKGILKFYEKNVSEAENNSDPEDNQSLNLSTTSLLDQYVGHVRESLGIESHLSSSSQRLSSRSSANLSETESEADDLWQQHLEELGGKLNAENDRTGFLRMVNRNHVFNASNYSISSMFSFSGSINGLSMSRGSSVRKSSRGWNGRPPLGALYELLISPVEDFLPETNNETKKELVLVLQGDLYLVPFAVLRSSQTSTYLYEHYSIIAVPSITALQNNVGSGRYMKMGHEATGALIVGNPELPPSVKDQYQWGELPAAEMEAKIIGEMMGAKPLIGQAAVKDVVLQHMGKTEVIHFAAHVSWKLSAVILSPGEFATPDSRERFHDDSGSDISGCMDSPSLSEFLLTAADILNVRFSSKLVVLSSGHSDDRAGRINSDGVVGLTRALLAAGAHAVLFSLWPVPAEASKIFMRTFYTALLQGCNASRSLVEGMKSVQTNKQFSHPSNWGGWVLVGSDVKLSSKVALMGHAFYELLQQPARCRESMRVLLHLVEKSLQRIHKGQKNAMYTTQMSIENKVGNIPGWKDLLTSVGFRFEPAANGLPPAVFFPVTDPGERLTQCSASLQALLGLPPTALIPLSKLLTQYEAGEAIIQLLREVNGRFTQKEPKIEVTLRVKLWRVPGCHEFLASLGFDLADVGKDVVTIKAGKQANKRITQFALNALLAVLDTQEAPRSLSLDSSSSMESLASSSSQTSTSNISKSSTPPDSPHGRGRIGPVSPVAMDRTSRLHLMQQGGLVGRTLPGYPSMHYGAAYRWKEQTSPFGSSKVEDAFRYGGPSGTSLQGGKAGAEGLPKVLGVEIENATQQQADNVSVSSSSASDSGLNYQPVIKQYKHRIPTHPYASSPSEDEEAPVAYNPPPITDYTALNRQSHFRSSAASGSSTLTGKSSGGLRRSTDTKSYTSRSSTKSSASDRTLTSEPQSLSMPKRTESDSSTKSNTSSEFSERIPIDPTAVAQRVLADVQGHRRAVEQMQRHSIHELQKQRMLNAQHGVESNSGEKSKEQMSNGSSDTKKQPDRLPVNGITPNPIDSDSSTERNDQRPSHPDGLSDSGRSDDARNYRPKPVGISSPPSMTEKQPERLHSFEETDYQKEIQGLSISDNQGLLLGEIPPGTPPPRYLDPPRFGSRPMPPPKPKHVTFDDSFSGEEFTSPTPPLPPPRNASSETPNGGPSYQVRYAEKKTVNMVNHNTVNAITGNYLDQSPQDNGPVEYHPEQPPMRTFAPVHPQRNTQGNRSPAHKGAFSTFLPINNRNSEGDSGTSDQSDDGRKTNQYIKPPNTFADQPQNVNFTSHFKPSGYSTSTPKWAPVPSINRSPISPVNRPGSAGNRPSSATSTSSQYSSSSSTRTVIHRPDQSDSIIEEPLNDILNRSEQRQSWSSSDGSYSGSIPSRRPYQGNHVGPRAVKLMGQKSQSYSKSNNQKQAAEEFELTNFKNLSPRGDVSDTDESVQSSQSSRERAPVSSPLRGLKPAATNGPIKTYYVSSDRQPVKKSRVLQSSKC